MCRLGLLQPACGSMWEHVAAWHIHAHACPPTYQSTDLPEGRMRPCEHISLETPCQADDHIQCHVLAPMQAHRKAASVPGVCRMPHEKVQPEHMATMAFPTIRY